MEAEILKIPPISGIYEEHNFSTSGNTVWVKFFDEEYNEWCGVFSLGWKSGSSVQKVTGKPVFIVLAGGNCYFVNVNDRKVEFEIESDDIEGITCNNDSGNIVVTDGLRIGILNNYQIDWVTERISLDGINFTGNQGLQVHGILNDCTDDGCAFEFNSKTGEVKSKWLFYQNIS